MIGTFESYKRIIIPLIIALLLVPVNSSFSQGSSIINDDTTSFSRGTFNHTVLGGNGIELDYEYGSNDSWPNNWTLMSQGRPGNFSLPIVYDSANNVLVLEEGAPYYPKNFTWIYDFNVNKWTMKSPPNAPSSAQLTAYDSMHGVVITHFSYRSYLIPGETWAFNVSLNVWTNMTPANGPVNHSDSAMVYDSVNHVLVLFGGGETYYNNDTWIYDYSVNTWTNAHPGNPPPARGMHAMAFDESSGEVILFGGLNRTRFNDTWAYNVSNNVWIQKAPAVSPPARYRSSMVYDSLEKETILFGGASDSGALQDTWTYSSGLNRWAKRDPENPPSNRSHSGFAFNSRANEAVLFGGYGGGFDGYYGDLWTYDLSRDEWTDITEHAVPPPCRSAAIAYDSRIGRSILFGGAPGNAYANCGTYSYDLATNTWARLYPACAPPARSMIPMVYDSLNDEMVIFGGCYMALNFPLGDTWTYNFTNNKWTNRNPVSHPENRFLQAMAFDSTTGKTILFGGFGDPWMGDTWSYDSRANNWTKLNPQNHPSQRYGAAMVYDEKNRIFVLFGGYDNDHGSFESDTWTYNITSNSWINRTPSKNPPGRVYHTMVYDKQMGTIIMYGGLAVDHICNDTWSYNATTNRWMKINTVRAPVARYDQGMTYDEANHAVVLFGGESTYYRICGDVWAFDMKHLSDSGNFISAQFDIGGNAHFGTLDWEAVTPAGSSVRFQLRTAETPKDLGSRPFIGPDRTPDTYYPCSGQQISSIHNGSRWFQYRAYFSSTDSSMTPLVKNVVVHYNLPPTIKLISPTGNENWTGEQEIAWTASTGDNDSLTFDIYLEKNLLRVPIAKGLPNGTVHWAWNTSSISNGTYRIRIEAHDGDLEIPVSANVTSANFTIYHPPPPNHPPHVDLMSPADKSIVNTTSVRLLWQGSDPDGDPLTYTVSYSVKPLFSGQVITDITDIETLDLLGLRDNTTYYWTVDANDTKTNRTDVATPIWRFTVELPPANRPPEITSLPGAAITVGERYGYNITAHDEDGDKLFYSIVSGPMKMTIDNQSGNLSWWPAATDIGNRTVTIEVSDGRGGTDRQIFTIVVHEAPALPPPERSVCRFSSPANGSTVHGLAEIQGTAAKGTFPLVIVRLRIDDGEWTTAIGLENWSQVIDTGKLSNGKHRLEAWSFDGSVYSDTASIDIIVNNKEPVRGGTNYIQGAIPVIIIVIAVLIALVLFGRRMKKRK